MVNGNGNCQPTFAPPCVSQHCIMLETVQCLDLKVYMTISPWNATDKGYHGPVTRGYYRLPEEGHANPRQYS